jgi:hypothetical protein
MSPNVTQEGWSRHDHWAPDAHLLPLEAAILSTALTSTATFLPPVTEWLRLSPICSSACGAGMLGWQRQERGWKIDNLAF